MLKRKKGWIFVKIMPFSDDNAFSRDNSENYRKNYAKIELIFKNANKENPEKEFSVVWHAGMKNKNFRIRD